MGVRMQKTVARIARIINLHRLLKTYIIISYIIVNSVDRHELKTSPIFSIAAIFAMSVNQFPALKISYLENANAILPVKTTSGIGGTQFP